MHAGRIMNASDYMQAVAELDRLWCAAPSVENQRRMVQLVCRIEEYDSHRGGADASRQDRNHAGLRQSLQAEATHSTPTTRGKAK